MTSPVFFSTGAAATTSASRNLVEFKAGKMELRDKMVHPIKKKGLVYLRQSDDNLMHFYWKDRQSGVVEDDLILFPDDCEVKRVKECTTGRVYVLKMKSSDKRMFFWMQEPSSDLDDDHWKKINEMLNSPPRAGLETSGPGERDIQAILNSMSQEQIAQLLSPNGINGINMASLLNAAGRSPSSNSGGSVSSTASTTNSSAPVSANQPSSAGPTSAGQQDLRTLLSSAMMEGNEEEADALVAATLGRAVDSGSSRQQAECQSVMIDLSHVINSESLAHLLEDDQFLRHIEPHLPPISHRVESQAMDVDSGKKEASDTIRSSQFKSSLSQFCTALQSGQLGPLMSQFGLNQECVDAASLGNLEAFVRALEKQMSSSSSTDSSKADDQNKQTSSEQKEK